MNFFVLASLIVFAAVITRIIKKRDNESVSDEYTFWEREQASNSVRRKSLDSLDYIHIPLESFPMDVLTENTQVCDYQDLIRNLSDRPIVNLTGYTNTDLKLEYGTANITALSEYDQNYTILVRTLQQWADVLLDAGYQQEAVVLMEFALHTGTDISRTYYKLANIHASRGDIFQIEALIRQAESLRSSNRDTIVRTLRESYL